MSAARGTVERYRANYGLRADGSVTVEKVSRHWDLERWLRTELLESTPDTRWTVFERCYSQLYAELHWLNSEEAEPTPSELANRYAKWTEIIGPRPLKVLEIGSGKGRLIHHLATRGHECKGTEVTRERGGALAPHHPNLQWGTTDGVHLDRFEPRGSYDVVISDQVVEHLHPDDLVEHLTGAYSVLVNDGRYILSTPNRLAGPFDVSRVFGCNAPLGMHLKEYSHGELRRAFRAAGFGRVQVVLRAPASYRRLTRGLLHPKPSAAYTAFVLVAERLLDAISRDGLRRRAVAVLRLLLFPSNIMLLASKGPQRGW